MIKKYNVYYNCDINKIPDIILKKISIEYWTDQQKIVQKQVQKTGNNVFIIVNSIYNKNNEYDPSVIIKIDKSV